MVNYTPVAIKHVVNEATIIAHFDGREKITYRDLIEAQDVHEYGLRQLSELTPIERRRLAYHEAGHTVASYYLMDRYYPAFVTLHVRGDVEGAAAFAHPRPKETIITQNREDILANIQVNLASRAAEELFLNTALSGVTSDFATATRLAAAYIGAFGMDGTIISYMAFGGGLTGLSPQSLPDMDKRAEALLQSQLRAVKQLFMDHREALIAVAEALIERDELIADEIKELIDSADARKAVQTILSEFTPMLEASGNGNGYSGSRANGHAKGTPSLPSPQNNLPLNTDLPPTTGIGEISPFRDDGSKPAST
jgi:ATP-dependent Zn protease